MHIPFRIPSLYMSSRARKPTEKAAQAAAEAAAAGAELFPKVMVLPAPLVPGVMVKPLPKRPPKLPEMGRLAGRVKVKARLSSA